MKKQFEPSFNIIRAVSAFMIVFIHYSYCFAEYGIKNEGPGFLRFKNSDIGGVFVTMFFMLSGAALLYNHPDFPNGKSVLRFYKKRWLTIFPMFYIAWGIMYVINSLRFGGWFWGGPRKNFLLTFIGMDGYFLHLGMNYYCLGEWFLGAIIILYLLYPLLVFIWNKAKIPGTLLVAIIFLFNLRRHYFSSAPDTNIFIVLIKFYNSHITISDNMCVWTCLADFWCGFLLVTYLLPAIKKLKETKKDLIALLINTVVLSLFFLIEMPMTKQEVSLVMAFLYYLEFTLLTPYITPVTALNSLMNLISKYSYGIFLVHHVMIYAIMTLLKDHIFTRATSLIMFIPLYAVIIMTGILLTKLTDLIMKPLTRLYTRLVPTPAHRS